jgi:rare lipoprotein A
VNDVLAEDVDVEAVVAVPAPPAPGEGLASWYGPGFHGRLTACGEVFDQHALTAAHRTLPFGTLIAVTNIETGCRVMLRINDRGPYHGRRILDCSRAAAEELGFIDRGVTRVVWEIVDDSPPPDVGPQGTMRPTFMEAPS